MNTTYDWQRGNDHYGRSVHYLNVYDLSPAFLPVSGHTVAVVVKLPDGCKDKYLVNIWTKRGTDAVSYHPTFAAAKRYALTNGAGVQS